MKKILITTTALVLTAGAASADVTISGIGRSGLVYYENDTGKSETQIESMFRLHLNASVETDNGLTFGGEMRVRYDTGAENSKASPAKLYVTHDKYTVEVGNVESAIDYANLMYATELGPLGRSTGVKDRIVTYYYFEENAYANPNRVGLNFLYAGDALTVRASYIDTDQSGLNETSGFVDGKYVGVEVEIALSVGYVWNETLELSGAYVSNAAGIKDSDIFYLAGRYKVNENAHIGLQYFDTSEDAGDNITAEDGTMIYGASNRGDTVALFGDYTLSDGVTNIEGYVANNDAEYNKTDFTFGIGAMYDLGGGARLGASLQSDYNENMYAAAGFTFNF